jgi:hypothetical protein
MFVDLSHTRVSEKPSQPGAVTYDVRYGYSWDDLCQGRYQTFVETLPSFSRQCLICDIKETGIYGRMTW